MDELTTGELAHECVLNKNGFNLLHEYWPNCHMSLNRASPQVTTSAVLILVVVGA
jgi:hypothetical protein